MYHKIGETTIYDAEDLDLVNMQSNRIQFKLFSNNRKFYSKDGTTNFNVNIINDSNFKIFKHKAKLLGNTEAQPNPNNDNGILKKYNNCCALKVFQ